MKRPLIAYPGDPAGIGPEIVVKALASRELVELSRPLWLVTAGWHDKPGFADWISACGRSGDGFTTLDDRSDRSCQRGY